VKIVKIELLDNDVKDLLLCLGFRSNDVSLHPKAMFPRM
jgi:hypothetical protein